jgi:hypothetical protein
MVDTVVSSLAIEIDAAVLGIGQEQLAPSDSRSTERGSIAAHGRESSSLMVRDLLQTFLSRCEADSEDKTSTQFRIQPVKIVASMAIVRGCGRVLIQLSSSRRVAPTLPS